MWFTRPGVSLQDALEETKDSELKLKALPQVCNETMMALWEECKPCLKQTCMKFYARVCRSGSGLVGRQVKGGLCVAQALSGE